MKYDILIDEALSEGLIVKEKPLQGNDGLIVGNRIAIRKSIETTAQKSCVLAEELGHYHTSVGDILDQTSLDSQKQELKARRWAYEKMVPVENIRFAIADGHVEIWDMAEYLDVDEEFLREVLEYYAVVGKMIFLDNVG